MSAAGVVILAVGNRSRGDDAIGPMLLERLAAWLEAAGRTADFALIEDYQLQIEHALDLVGRRLVLFVDAGTGTRVPYDFREVEAAAPSAGHSSHSLAPAAVLGVYRQVSGAPAPPAFVLCVRGERFGLGEDLSAPARDHVDAAWRRLVALCEQPDVGRWRTAATRTIAGTTAAESAAAVSAARRISSRRARG